MTLCISSVERRRMRPIPNMCDKLTSLTSLCRIMDITGLNITDQMPARHTHIQLTILILTTPGLSNRLYVGCPMNQGWPLAGCG